MKHRQAFNISYICLGEYLKKLNNNLHEHYLPTLLLISLFSYVDAKTFPDKSQFLKFHELTWSCFQVFFPVLTHACWPQMTLDLHRKEYGFYISIRCNQIPDINFVRHILFELQVSTCECVTHTNAHPGLTCVLYTQTEDPIVFPYVKIHVPFNISNNP